MLRTIAERTLEMQNDLHLCFIDYVKFEEIINLLKRLNLVGKDLRIIKNMYWQQTAAVKVDNETSVFQKIKKVVRQGCVLSPDLFSLYSEHIMRHIEGLPGISFGGQIINNLR